MKVVQSEERIDSVQIGYGTRQYASPELKVLGLIAELTKGQGGTKIDGNLTTTAKK